MNRIETDLLKERIDLVKVIGHYLSLEKKGVAYMALCPFHADRNPSLRIDPRKGLYHCFSCGAGGDAFRFVQEKEGCGFSDAVRICAAICDVSLPALHAGSQKHKPGAASGRTAASRRAEEPVKPYPAIEENERFRHTLLPYDPGMDELRETYLSFGVGVAPAVIPEAYHFTRGRIVFPIHNAAGEPVAFAARYQGASTSKKILKYINSSTSPLYKKGELLYAWHRAIEKIRETGIVFVTEGYKDALAMHAAGFTNAVALCGVVLSTYHIELIRKEAFRVFLLLDADERGRETVSEVVPVLRKAGLEVVDIVPEGGKDPDEMFRALGRKAFVRWMHRRMIPLVRREAESLLVSACMRWPKTGCLTADGSEMPYIENIMEILEYDGLLPEEEENRELLCAVAAGHCSDYTPDSVSDAGLPDYEAELLRQYDLHTEPSHSEPVRRSELVRYLFLHYLEVRLTDQVRRNMRDLSASHADEGKRVGILSALQYGRNYLCRVSQELGRR